MLFVTAALFFVSAVWTGAATSYPGLIIARLIGGIGVGGASVMDATKDLPNVCRVMVSRCDCCQDDTLSRIVEPHQRRLPREFVDDIVEQAHGGRPGLAGTEGSGRERRHRI